MKLQLLTALLAISAYSSTSTTISAYSSTSTTTRPPSTTTTIGVTDTSTTWASGTTGSGNEYCLNGGTVSCSCPDGFTGDRCEQIINWCINKPQVLDNGEVVNVDPCFEGTCKYDVNSGSSCECYPGWNGTFCDQPIPSETTISHRCEFHFASSDPTGCADSERCLPDNLDCAFGGPDCTNSQGWCLPMATQTSILAQYAEMKKVAKTRQVVKKFDSVKF
jgi:hypothetical protein